MKRYIWGFMLGGWSIGLISVKFNFYDVDYKLLLPEVVDMNDVTHYSWPITMTN